MHHVRAIGFDLFNTLITADPVAIEEAVVRLTRTLKRSGLPLEYESFKEAHREAALRFIEETRRDGKETHNRFWVSAALMTQGHSVRPDDPRIAEAVDAYFSAFVQYCQPLPGTRDMLEALKGPYRLGLLSNFTHGPAVRKIVDKLGLGAFFDVLLISGELGYRKPHPIVFRRLVEGLGFAKNQIIYVGDDLEPDITGAQQAGLQPVWMTYVRDKKIPFSPDIPYKVDERPVHSVPRISNWTQFIALLNRRQGEPT